MPFCMLVKRAGHHSAVLTASVCGRLAFIKLTMQQLYNVMRSGI